MSKIPFHGKVDASGKLHIVNRRLFDMGMKAFIGKEVTGFIERKKTKRSNQQNRWYWGICVPLVWKGLRDAGYNEVQTLEDTHEILKGLFNKKSFADPSTGEVTTYGASTTSLSTVEFMEYKEAIQQWAAEALDVFIPDPTETLTETA